MKTEFRCLRCNARFVEGDAVILNSEGIACCWDCFQEPNEPLVKLNKIFGKNGHSKS